MKDIRRATRRQFSAEEKIRIVLDGLRGEDSIVWNLNATPRKCLGFKTPIEAFASQLGVALEN